MVHQFRVSLTCFILFLLLLATSFLSVHSRNTLISENHKILPRKRRFNHGSHRGPKKHLLNPTNQNLFQSREFPL
ncbi:hypothetical protein VIGAN_10119100 [Vigna angularis var. angularis]|uniref:Uncharacterized protein n=1 Tax=Vigna angularis var. angularis TaxID=157739 RepID=A0A0S3T3L1_PHAAN|nr:hypothetical protein VIGAN_10119100 [Vigna angularis var. angularis]